MTTVSTPRKIATTATAGAALAKGSHTPVDATSGALTMTLPTTATAGVELSVEKVDASANAVTISGTLRGSSSTIVLGTQFEARTFLSEGAGSWRPTSDHRTAAALAATYAPVDDTQRSLALRNWFAALGNRDNAPANILTIGDSITEGRGATAYTKRASNRVRDILRSRFPTAGLTTGGENYLPPQFMSPLPQVFTIGGAPSLNAGFGIGLRGYTMTGAGQQFSGTITGTSMDVVYLRGSSTGSFTVTVDGGAATTVNTINAGGTLPGQKTTISLGAAGAHTVVIAWSAGGSVFFSGVHVYNGDETKGIRMFDGGHSGFKSGDFLPAGIAGGGTWLAAELALVAPHLVIIGLGVNDWNNAVTAATFKANLLTIISFVRASVATAPSIVLQATYDAGTGTGPWSAFVAAMQEIAAADTGGPGGASGIVVFDLSKRLPNRVGDTLSLYADTVHPNDKGYAMIADPLASFISPR